MDTRAFVVSGRVQGVGFRYSTMEKARDLGLNGFVANQPDGSVYVVIQGEGNSLDQMEQWLHHGPPFAHVAAVESRATDRNEIYTSFTIKRL